MGVRLAASELPVLCVSPVDHENSHSEGNPLAVLRQPRGQRPHYRGCEHERDPIAEGLKIVGRCQVAPRGKDEGVPYGVPEGEFPRSVREMSNAPPGEKRLPPLVHAQVGEPFMEAAATAGEDDESEPIGIIPFPA